MSTSLLISESELKQEIIAMASHINAATYRFLMMIGEYDRRRLLNEWECRSMAHWLNWHCSMCLGAAREHVRVARAMTGLPIISKSFASGELSYSKARALTRIAEPTNESDLLKLALELTATQLDRLVAGYRQVERNEENRGGSDLHKQRSADHFWDDDGCLVVRSRLSPEDGAMYINALEAARLDVPVANPEGKKSSMRMQNGLTQTPS